MRTRVAILHGVNLDTLGRRPAAHYGDLTLGQLELKIEHYGNEYGLETPFFQTNFEGEFVEELHRAPDYADAVLLNPGAWTHYSWAIRDALEVCGLPAAEVHLSDVENREPFRRQSVIADLCRVRVFGKGPEGYDEALKALAEILKEPVDT